MSAWRLYTQLLSGHWAAQHGGAARHGGRNRMIIKGRCNRPRLRKYTKHQQHTFAQQRIAPSDLLQQRRAAQSTLQQPLARSPWRIITSLGLDVHGVNRANSGAAQQCHENVQPSALSSTILRSRLAFQLSQRVRSAVHFLDDIFQSCLWRGWWI